MYYFLNIESFSLVPITPWAYCSNYSPTPWAYFSNYSHVLLAAPPLKYCCWRSPLMHPEFFMISCTRQVGFSQRECIVQVFTAHVLGKTIQSKSNPRYIHAPVSGSAAYLQSVGVCVCVHFGAPAWACQQMVPRCCRPPKPFLSLSSCLCDFGLCPYGTYLWIL